MYTKNQQLTIEITDLTEQGEGVGKIDGFALFVKDTVPGDVAEVAITKVKKNYAYARLLRVLTPSPDRVRPICPVARACGGCQLQMMRYEAQLAFKEKRVRDALERIGGFSDLSIEPILAAEGRLRYRNKTQVPVGTDREGWMQAGFYAGRTHSIIPAKDCLLAPEENAVIIDRVLAWAEENGIPAYDEMTGEGVLRHILIRKGFLTGEVLVCLVVKDGKLLPADLAEQIAYDLSLLPSRTCPAPRLVGLAVNHNPKRTNVILGEKTKTVWGRPYIEDRIGETSYRVSAESFYQVNPEQTKKLYDTVRRFASLTGEEVIWDLYCGTGTIGLYLAPNACRVVGIEVVPQAIEDARENARVNRIENAEFFCGAAEDIATDGLVSAGEGDSESASGSRPDLIILDPPRKGCDEKLLSTILTVAPEKVIYVSCDPSTLARDLAVLCEKDYAIEAVQPVDMFPQSVHVESVVLITRRG